MAIGRLDQHERYRIHSLHEAGYCLRDIALALERAPSTISGELRRNAIDGRYDPPSVRSGSASADAHRPVAGPGSRRTSSRASSSIWLKNGVQNRSPAAPHWRATNGSTSTSTGTSVAVARCTGVCGVAAVNAAGAACVMVAGSSNIGAAGASAPQSSTPARVWGTGRSTRCMLRMAAQWR